MDVLLNYPRLISLAAVLVAGAVAGVLLRLSFRKPKPLAVPTCPQCRYCMAQLDKLECPECGHKVASLDDWKRPGRRRTPVVQRVIAGAMLLYVLWIGWYVVAFVWQRHRFAPLIDNWGSGDGVGVKYNMSVTWVHPQTLGEAIRCLGSEPWVETVQSITAIHAGIGDDDLAVIGSCPELRRVTINSARITDKSISTLVESGAPRLQNIDFSHTGITDKGIAELAAANIYLGTIDLSYTAITDEGAASLAHSPQVTSIRLRCTKVRGTLARFAHHPNLRVLSLADTNADDESIAFQSVPLIWLDLSGTQMHGPGLSKLRNIGANWAPMSLQAARSLQVEYRPRLFLDRTSVDDDGLKPFAEMPSLVSLSLAATRIRGPGLAFIHSTLLSLNLADTLVDDEGLKHLGKADGEIGLELLILHGTKIKGPGLECLRQALVLRTLDLSNTEVDDQCIDVLASLPGLECLHIEHTKITREGIVRLMEQRRKANLPSVGLVRVPAKLESLPYW